VAGTYTSLAGWTQAFTNGDQFTIAIENQVLYVYDKTLTQVKSYDDSGGGGPTTGNVGISFSSIETSALLDNWSGGTFSSAGGATAVGRPIRPRPRLRKSRFKRSTQGDITLTVVVNIPRHLYTTMGVGT